MKMGMPTILTTIWRNQFQTRNGKKNIYVMDGSHINQSKI